MTSDDPDEHDDPAAEPRPWLSDDEIRNLRSLIEVIEHNIPERHHRIVLREALRRALAPARPTAPAEEDRRVDHDVPRREPSAPAMGPEPSPGGVRPIPARDGVELDLARYAVVLAEPGRTLLKGLVALDVAETQLAIPWMTPAEIETLLRRRARVAPIYRTNLSNALRDARGLIDRRRRGRAYEYRLTDAGRNHLYRALALGPY